jgi:hypothetical protein
MGRFASSYWQSSRIRGKVEIEGNHMPFDLDETALANAEARFLKDDLYARIGFFMTAFGMVEYNLSRIMCLAFAAGDIEKFDFILRGMDVRAKIERLQSGNDIHYKLGPNFIARLENMQKRSLPIRNSLAHSFLSHDNERMYMSSLGAAPHVGELKLTKASAPYITKQDLFIEALWLRMFFEDLSSVVSSWDKSHPEKFEIASPKTGLPKPNHPPSLQRSPYATHRKRAKTPPSNPQV